MGLAELRIISLLYAISLLPYHSLTFSLCTNFRVPSKLKAPLKFCRYTGSSCCDYDDDYQLQKQYDALNVSDPHCAALLRSIICAKCDQYSALLFNVGIRTRNIPFLCNSTVSGKSYQSKADTSIDFCSKVWDTCGNVPIYNSPFTQRKTDGSDTKLVDEWQSKQDFCAAYGGSPVCFNGETSSFSNEIAMPIEGVCIEKIANGSYLSLAPHPDGSDNIFLSTLSGQIWQATVPKQGSNQALGIDESQPFIDISDQILFQAKLGLMSIAFHPKFIENGRVFASFNCDKLQHSGCSGRCSCNTDVNCDPADLGNDNGISPCQYHSVIAEYSANRTSHTLTQVRRADPTQVRRIFTMGLPTHNGYGGQILFGPRDGYLYYVVGDQTHGDDSRRISRNKKSILGKILRIDVDRVPSSKEKTRNLWGNYSVPEDNPYIEDQELLPEIWAFGVRNPWRCSFDSERPSCFLCGDSGQALFEEVDLITKGGNYGWPNYEGPYLNNQSNSPETDAIINPIFPVMGYNDAEVASKGGAASLIGGYIYRSIIDPCLYGRYLYTDVYAGTIWVGTEQPENSGNFTSKRLPWTCAKDSPLMCDTKPGSLDAAIGFAFSFGEDNRKDVYLLSSSGVYRIVDPARCEFKCLKNDHDKQQSSSMNIRSQSSCSSFNCKSYSLLEMLFFLFVTRLCYHLKLFSSKL